MLDFQFHIQLIQCCLMILYVHKTVLKLMAIAHRSLIGQDEINPEKLSSMAQTPDVALSIPGYVD